MPGLQDRCRRCRAKEALGVWGKTAHRPGADKGGAPPPNMVQHDTIPPYFVKKNDYKKESDNVSSVAAHPAGSVGRLARASASTAPLLRSRRPSCWRPPPLAGTQCGGPPWSPQAPAAGAPAGPARGERGSEVGGEGRVQQAGPLPHCAPACPACLRVPVPALPTLHLATHPGPSPAAHLRHDLLGAGIEVLHLDHPSLQLALAKKHDVRNALLESVPQLQRAAWRESNACVSLGSGPSQQEAAVVASAQGGGPRESTPLCAVSSRAQATSSQTEPLPTWSAILGFAL